MTTHRTCVAAGHRTPRRTVSVRDGQGPWRRVARCEACGQAVDVEIDDGAPAPEPPHAPRTTEML